MVNREGTKGSKGAKGGLREGQNPSQNGGPGELPVGQARPRVGNERGVSRVRRSRPSHRRIRTSTASNSEVEKPGTLTRKQIIALQRAYTSGAASMEKLSEFFGYSVATVSKYCSGLEVKVPAEPDTPTQTSSAAPTAAAFHAPIVPPPTNGGDSTQSELQREGGELPRRSYEITATKPIIVDEENNGSESETRHELPARPISDQPLERLFAYAALSKGMNTEEFVREIVLPDLRTMGIIRSALPGTSNEELEQNFLRTCEDANSFRKLIRTSREQAREEMKEKNNGNTF